MIANPGSKIDVDSAERSAMSRDLDLIEDIRAGVTAMRAHSARYLPQYEAEGRDEYNRRVNSAPWRGEFADVLLTLASKPFSKQVRLQAGAPDELESFSHDVDTLGNSLHVFARRWFMDALANGVSYLMVDYPIVKGSGPVVTVRDHIEAGARPYWHIIPAKSVIALYSEMRKGRDMVTHIRFWEYQVERDGFEEKVVKQIRVFEPGKWEVWRKDLKSDQYALFESGPYLTPDMEMQIVPLFTGERLGHMQVRPPLIDLAHMQVELWRALSLRDEILTYSGSPMLSAQGVRAPEGQASIKVGPKHVLYAAPDADGKSGTWSYVQPDARNLAEIRQHVANVISDMQRLGLQPIFDRTGDVSATEAGLAASKAHSAIESWALGLKDALERAMEFTIYWLKGPLASSPLNGYAPVVEVHTDFGADIAANLEADMLLRAEERQIISAKTVRDEFARRGVLGPSFDAEEEDKRLAAAETETEEGTEQ